MTISASTIVNGTDAAASGTTATVTLVPAAGDSLEVLITCANAQTINAPTSAPTETWALIKALNDTTSAQRTELWGAQNATGGSTVITETYSAATTFRAMSGKVISGTSGLDKSAAQLQATPTTGADATSSTATATLTSQPALISGWSNTPLGTPTPAAGTGFTNDGNGWPNSGLMRSESKVLTATTGVAATFTAGQNIDHMTFAAVYLESGGAPTITTQPTAKREKSGSTTTFDIAATTSGGALHYQWKDDGANVGTDSSSYTTATLALGDNGSEIYCVVSDDNGSTNSSVVTLTVFDDTIGLVIGSGLGFVGEGYIGASDASGGMAPVLQQTEASDTLSATATSKIAASLTQTEAAETLSSTATLAIVANATNTEAADVLSATATSVADLVATFAQTEANDTISASATIAIRGILAQTEGNDTISAAATVAIAGALAQTEGADTIASTATLAIAANLSITEAGDTLSAYAAQPNDAILAQTEASDTLSATAGVVVRAALAATEGPDTAASTAAVAIAAILSQTESPDTITAAGALAIAANVSQTEGNDVLSAAGTTLGSMAAVLQVTEQADALSSTGTLALFAVASNSDQADTLNGAAGVAIAATLARTEANETISSTARLDIGPRLSVTEANDVASGTVTIRTAAAFAMTDGPDVLSSVGVLAIVANLAVTEANDTLSADANTGQPRTAVLSIVEANDTLSSTGTVSQPAAPTVGGSGKVRRRHFSRTVTFPEQIVDRRVAVLQYTEDDDELSCAVVLGESPIVRRNRRTLAVLLMA